MRNRYRKPKPRDSIGRIPAWKDKAFRAEPATQKHHVKRLGTFGPASEKRGLLSDPVAVAEAFASMEKARERQRAGMDRRKHLKTENRCFKPLNMKYSENG